MNTKLHVCFAQCLNVSVMFSVVVPAVPSTTEESTALPESTTEAPIATSQFLVPNWGIAVIVCGVVVLIFLLAMICVLVGKTGKSLQIFVLINEVL